MNHFRLSINFLLVLMITLVMGLSNNGLGQAPEVTHFTLVNSDTNVDIGTISEGDVIDLSVAGNALNIRANTIPDPTGSVVFKLNGKKETENVSPYSYAGDKSGDYKNMDLEVGSYTLEATPYDKAKGKGTAGPTLALNFTVILVPLSPSDLTATAISSSAIDLSWTDNSDDELGFEIYRSENSGSNFQLIHTTGESENEYTDTGLSANTLYFYTLSAMNSSGSSASTGEVSATTEAVAAVPTVVSFTLINSDTDTDIGTIGEGDIIDLSVVGNALNIRANTIPDPTGSVVFQLNGKDKTENASPYAYEGDNSGDYKNMDLEVGTYTLEATAYDEAKGKGIAGPTLAINFTVILGEVPPAPSDLVATAIGSSSIDLSWTDNSNNEFGFEVNRFKTSGSDFQLIHTTGENITNYTDTGLESNTLYFYTINAINGAGSSASTEEASATTEAVATVPTVTSFTLVNADTDEDIGLIEEGDEIDLTITGVSLNIRANTNPDITGSVVISLDGISNTESVSPYAYGGDNSGDYKVISLAKGDHQIQATAYDETGGGGTSGPTFTINFSVVCQGLVLDELEIQSVRSIHEINGGDSWINNTNWPKNASEWEAVTNVEQMADWFGITVVNRDIVRIELVNNDLTGQLHESIGDLRALNFLRLTVNGLTGTPPTSLGQLTNLTYLSLANNNFTGQAPQSITNLALLDTLYLDDNSFTGIPDFSAYSTPENIRYFAHGNNLTFETLEPNFTSGGHIFNFLHYHRQTPAIEEEFIAANIGEDITLDATDGDNTSYQWQYGTPNVADTSWNDIPGANNPTHTDALDATGTELLIRCAKSNTLVPGVPNWEPGGQIIYSTTFILQQPSSIVASKSFSSGRANSFGGATPSDIELADAKIYPNPFSAEINVIYPQDWQLVEMHLYNVHGSETAVRLNPGIQTPGLMNMTLKDGLAPGIYMLKLNFNEGRQLVKRLVKKG